MHRSATTVLLTALIAMLPLAGLGTAFQPTAADVLDDGLALRAEAGIEAAGQPLPPGVGGLVPETPLTRAPGPARTLVAALDGRAIVLYWTAPDSGPAPIAYEIHRNGHAIADTDRTTYRDEDIVGGTTYVYAVVATNAFGEAPPSNEARIRPAFAPDAPVALQTLADGPAIALLWQPPLHDGGEPVISYRVYGVGNESGRLFAETSDTSFRDEVGYSRSRTYAVAAVNALGEGPRTDPVMGSSLYPPGAARDLSALLSGRSVELRWEAPENASAPVDAYRVYARHDGGWQLRGETTARTFLDASLPPGTTMGYHVRASNAAGEGAASNEANATVPGRPLPPTNVTATGGVGAIEVRWAHAHAGAFRVERATPEGAFAPHATTGARSFVDEGLGEGASFRYRIVALDDALESDPSAVASATTMKRPGAPTLSRGNDTSPTQATLVWNAVAGATHYRVYVGKASGVHDVLLNETNATSALAVRDPGTRYYVVAAVNAVGEGARSNEVDIRTPTAPQAPHALVATDGNGSVHLAWQPPADDGGRPVTEWRVYRGNASGQLTLLARIPANGSAAHTDASAPVGVRQHYAVSAVNALGEGPRSNEASGVAVAPPSDPRNLVARGLDDGVRLTWDAPTHDGGRTIARYVVYRSHEGQGHPGGNQTSRLAEVDAATRTFTDGSAARGTTYTYWVRAANDVGEGAASNAAKGAPNTVPGAPRDVRAQVNVPSTETRVTWSAPESNGGAPVLRYRVWRGTDATHMTLLAEVPADEFRYWDAGCNTAAGCAYAVSAVNRLGEGPRSTIAHGSV